MTVIVTVILNQTTKKNAQENVTQVVGAIRPGLNVLKAVMVEPKEEGLCVSTLKMRYWMIANVHIRRKSPFRGATSFPVLCGNLETGQSAWSPVEKVICIARSGVSLAKTKSTIDSVSLRPSQPLCGHASSQNVHPGRLVPGDSAVSPVGRDISFEP